MSTALALSEYKSLAELRYQLRRFLHFSEQAARNKGLEPQQHQLMLALKGLPRGIPPAIGELADRLQIQHHSTVELVNRLSARGLVRRSRMASDRREVLLIWRRVGFIKRQPIAGNRIRSAGRIFADNYARTVAVADQMS